MPLLLDLLAQRFPAAKRTTLKRMVQVGRVTVNGVKAHKLKQSLQPTDRLDVLDHGPLPQRSADPLKIIHEDADVIVVAKPAGLLTSTVPREKRPTALAILCRYLAAGEPSSHIGLIHRLDRDASGLLVFSKHHEAYRSLKEQFFTHAVERVYTARVTGVPNPRSGRIDSRLVELPDGSVRPTQRLDRGVRAVLEYEVIDDDRKTSLLRVTLLTGRKHQIRAQLAARGHPVVGDATYGQPSPDAQRRGLLLVATRLAFNHPRTGLRVSFEIEPPAAMLTHPKE
jgi:23S rRNA pseudouridine1911/1915/1917 synthase